MMTACIICFNEEDHIEYTLRNIFQCRQWVNQIVIVEGAIQALSPFSNPDGSSTDKTMDVISDTVSKYGSPDVEVIVKRGLWKSKSHMRNEYLKYVKNPYIMLWDADEFFMPEDIEWLDNLTKQVDVSCVMMPLRHFHHDFKHIGVGLHWDATALRFSKFYKGCSYAQHYTLSDDKGRPFQWHDDFKSSRYYVSNHINKKYSRAALKDKGIILEDKEIWIYHLGYLKKDDDVAMKLALYAKRDQKKEGDIMDIFKHERQYNGMFDKRLLKGINPDPNGIQRYDGPYPEILTQHKWFDKIKIKYENQEEYDKANPPQ